MRFKDRVALITAAASGIGRATAGIMAAEGAVVVAVDNNAERLDEMVEALRATQGRVHGRQADALDARQVDALVPAVAQEFGAIDILVNAVGGSTVIAKSNAPVDELSFADWQNLIAFNLEGTFLFCHAVTPIMKRQRRGKIVNLASIAGRGLSNSSSSAYAAAKGGIIAFTRKLSFELGPFGINVNAIRAEPDADRAHPPALGEPQPGRTGGRDRAHAAAPGRRGGRPGAGDRLPGVERRRLRHRRDHRRDRGIVRVARVERSETRVTAPSSVSAVSRRGVSGIVRSGRRRRPVRAGA
jgi:NAD(P)-dependent dehydrogenase (short-subunit alcohol dehydrogenase family)